MIPDESEEHFANFTRLIEETFEANNGKKVVIVCHSNGCTYNYDFFLHKDAAWKEKYIQSWVTLGAPFAGATEALQAVVGGVSFHFAFYSKSLLGGLEKTFSSITPLIPVASVFADRTIFRLEGRNYTAREVADILALLPDSQDVAGMWEQSVRRMRPDFPAPGIETHCIRSSGLATIEALDFKKKKSFPLSPTLVYGEGDGSVNKVSSDVCLRWNSEPDFHTIEFNSSVNHIALATSSLTVDYLIKNVLHL